MVNQPISIGNKGKANIAATINKTWLVPVLSLKLSSCDILLFPNMAKNVRILASNNSKA
jgi:hypothetical protein